MAISIQINFLKADISFVPKQKKLLRQWIALTIQAHHKKLGQIDYIFCSDEYLLQMNKQYLNHHTLTDIITFDYSNELTAEVAGEIYISINRVRENAEVFKCTFNDELHRVMIHGVLHLCGFKDKTKNQKQIMRAQEDEAIKSLKKLQIHP
ncbi:MAG: rRNA maturation RNase YbeY [Bacteroidota bacterium]